jgi:tocopherol O-methyltransferase
LEYTSSPEDLYLFIAKRNVAVTISNYDIARYYDTHQFIYSNLWSATGLHYGLWHEGTASLSEAILNTNRFAVNVLAINSGDLVLDAGCGVGGTSIYVAETTGATVEAITLSSVQLRKAVALAARSPAVTLIHVSKQDYTQTAFGDEQFSKIFGIESVCYANDKMSFIREAYRLLKPGGKLAVIDAFLARNHLSAKERLIYENFIGGWVVPNLCTESDFYSMLSRVGFANVSFQDMSDLIWKSVLILDRISAYTYPINFCLNKLGLARRNASARFQRAIFEKKIAIYGTFLAEKPTD